MKWKSPQFWIAVCSIVAVITLALVDVGSTMPGPITKVHEREPELGGRRSCAECHGGWRETMTDACLKCHEAIGLQMQELDGLHGAIEAEKAKRCAICHSEHHGADFPIINVQSFIQAGASGRDTFEHDLVGFPMDGEHLELDCAECHENADVEVLDQGATRFIGLEQNCALCHEDNHDGAMVLECAQCHSQHDWETPGSMGHEKYLELVGGHGELGCLQCHKRNTARSIESMGSAGLQRAPRTCAICHESPHAKPFVVAVAEFAEMSKDTSCVTCHEPEHLSFRDENLVMTVEEHALTGFPLDAPHDQANCEDCHFDDSDDFAALYPGRGADDCSSCHEDVHEGQFDEGPFANQECFTCHDRQQFEPHAFTVELHELASLPLEGSHLEVECETCHERPADEEPRIFRGTPSDCEACHADAHQGFFEEFAQEAERVEHGECARCHLTTNFATVASERFDHATWTGFAIEGAHAHSDCESCHPRAEDPDENGRRFGMVSEHFGEYTGCATCHTDPHRGQFDTDELPYDVEGRVGCARCHIETSFRAFPDGFDHLTWTGFPLQGSHRLTSCSSCHKPRSRPDELGRTWGYAKGNNCWDCHQDSHQGQFEVGGRTNCRKCHRVAESFSELAFNHDVHSRFPLGEAHQKVACSACHPTVLQDGVEFTRYRPLKTGCADCHGEQDTRGLRRRKG